MDDGKGRFVEVSESKADELETKKVDGLFREGEVVELKGAQFKIHGIRSVRGMLILKLLPGD